MTKKTYSIGFTYAEGGYMTVQANTEKEAKQIVHERLSEEGFDAFRYKYQCCHREYNIIEAEQVNK